MKTRRVISLCLVLALLATVWGGVPMVAHAAEPHNHAEHLEIPETGHDHVHETPLATSPDEMTILPDQTPEIPAQPEDSAQSQDGIVASGTCGDNLTWTLDDAGTLTISGIGAMKSYTKNEYYPWYKLQSSIKAVVIEDDVASIANYAFKDYDYLNSVTFSDTVKTIGNYAFENCTKLTSITIPGSVTSIGACAFYDCSNLTNASLLDGINLIGTSAFQGCYKLQTIILPETINSIGANAFADCTQLSFSIYDNARYLGSKENPYFALIKVNDRSIDSYSIHPDTILISSNAFDYCYNLTNITIPDSVSVIDTRAFQQCQNLTHIEIGTGIKHVSSSAFTRCDMLQYNVYDNANYLGNKNTPFLALIRATSTDLVSCEIHPNTKTISDYAFAGCGNIARLEIPTGVISIGESAFSSCSNLIEINIPDGIQVIHDETFYLCTKLRNIIIPNSVTRIGDGVFSGCSDLQDVVFSSNITTIGTDAFGSCKNLIRITLPDSLIYIGMRSFDSCSNLKQVVFGHGLVEIAERAFQDCTSLTDIVIPENVLIISNHAFAHCEGITNVKISDSVTHIGAYAFYNCSNMQTLIIGNNVSNIGDYAFASCEGITNVKISDSVTHIGAYAFYYCSNMQTLIIGNNVSNIGDHAFYHCTQLMHITIPDSVTTIGTYSFANCPNIEDIYLGDSVTAIGKYAFSGCKNLKYLILGSSRSDTTTNISMHDGSFDNCYNLWHVLYKGTETHAKENLHIYGDQYYNLQRATWHYNCTGDEIIDPVNKLCALCCEHVYGDPVTVPATCTENGYTGYVCTICGYIIKESTIFATGHTFGDWIVDQEPTCDVPGSRHRECSVCGEAETEELTAQHQYGPWIMTGYWTCTEPGSRYHICYLCGYREDDIIPPTGHKHEAVVTPPTCTEQGYTTYTCHCGDYYVADYVPATGHIFIGRDCLNCDAVDENFENPTCGIDPSILYDRMMALQEYFPEGMPWTNDDFYEWNGGIYSGGYGCAAFAFLLSDAAFGTLPSEVITENITIDQIRVGDILRLYNDTHSVIVLEVYADYVVIAEGNYNSSIHWGRVLTADEIAADTNYIMTRYPAHVYTEEIFEPTCTTQGYTMHTCSACGDQYADSYIDALSHDYEGGVCKNCGDIIWPISGTCGDNLTWTLTEGGTLTISGTGAMWDFGWSNVPWQNYLTDIKIVIIEDGVASVGVYAFRSCSALTTVTIGKNATSIGAHAFWDCPSLSDIVIPDSVVTIGDHAFHSCFGLESVTLGNSVSIIGDYAFASCSSLSRVTFPKSVTEIGSYAFDRCTALTKIAFTGEAPTIGNNAFTQVVATVLYPVCNQTWTEQARQNYGGTLAWETYNNGHRFSEWVTDEEPTCTEFGNRHRTCSYCGMTETVEIPATGHSYDDGICHCGAIDWPLSGICGDNLTWTLTEDGTLTISGTGAMYDYSDENPAPWHRVAHLIKKIIISNGVTTIGANAFCGCVNLTTIVIADSVTDIRDNAFTGCSSLVSITLPTGLVSIAGSIFNGCSGLKEVVIPEGVISIGPGAFFGCTELISVTIPGTVTEIGSGAFSGCENLTTLVLPSLLTHIGDNAFAGCTALTSIVIPASVVSIGKNAFAGCTALAKITFLGEAPTIGENAFGSVTATVYYPDCNNTWTAEARQNYGGALTWVTYEKEHSFGDWVTDTEPTCTTPGSKHRTCAVCGKTETAEIPATDHNYVGGVCQNCGDIIWPISGTCGDNLTWTLTEDGLLTISGTGAMDDFAWSSAPWRQFSESIKQVVIEDGVTSIGNHAFFECSSLTNITIPSGVTSIGSHAFYNCSGMKSITIPSGVTSIGDHAFWNCMSLINITIPSGIRKIEPYTFWGCSSLTSITIPDGVVSIGNCAFESCSGLRSIIIPISVTKVDFFAFRACNYLWHVLYKGTEQQWSAIAIDETNEELLAATRHYNCTGDEIINPKKRICTLCCEHTDAEWIIDQHPTCTTPGSKHRTCAVCGKTETVEIPKADHTYTSVVTAPSCTERGYTTHTCHCGHSYKDTYKNALGHSFTKYVSDGNATTEKDGTKTAHCDHKCGATHTVTDVGSQLPPAKITSDVYTIKDGYISKIPVGMVATDFVKGINENGIRIQKNGSTITEDTKIGTGMVIQLVINGKVVDSLTIVVTGDTNGDGSISVTDMIAVKAHILKKTLLTGAAAKAADVNQDNSISITDFIQIKAHILGKSQVKPVSAKQQPKEVHPHLTVAKFEPKTESQISKTQIRSVEFCVPGNAISPRTPTLLQKKELLV